MVERRTIPYGSSVVLDRDRDYTYFTHADDESAVLRLAAGISSQGLIAAISRPSRIRRMAKLVGTEINMVDDTEIGFAENPRSLTTRELAEEISRVSAVDINSLKD